MQTSSFTVPPVEATEWAAALLQGAVTTGLAVLSTQLFTRYRRPWFGWFAVAWGLYVARLLCILIFLGTSARVWLYWHQVTTGWTALALLWAAMVFWRQPVLHRRWLVALLFPPLWSFIAIYQLDQFIWAALPAVLFLSGATVWTGWVFWRHHRTAASPGARLLAFAFLLWGLHHLDYPFLRAQGAWAPWGYYLDISFELLVGAGLVLLVLDDLGRGVQALTALSGDLQRRTAQADPMDLLLSRPLTLPGVRGAAMFAFAGETPNGQFTRGAGTCTAWVDEAPPPAVADALARMRNTRRPTVVTASGEHPFIAALPIVTANQLVGALVMAGDVRNPFTALNDDFLLALGQQVGAALEQFALDQQLAARTQALERLSGRMVRQHEDERRRLSRELHDETAQVFSAVKMQLEALRSLLPEGAAPRLDRLLGLVDQGIASIRQVTSDLRPSLLDDLGLLPALRSLVTDFGERSGLRTTLRAPEALPALSADAELALFRALQEALSNVARHAGASAVLVQVASDAAAVTVTVHDDGHGFPMTREGQVRDADGRMGLTGMRERLHGVGGTLTLGNQAPRGAVITLRVPLAAGVLA